MRTEEAQREFNALGYILNHEATDRTDTYDRSCWVYLMDGWVDVTTGQQYVTGATWCEVKMKMMTVLMRGQALGVGPK